MPLHLSQHKSYHPYNQANKQRVQRDQAQAAQQEAQQQQAVFARCDQARLDALRAGRKSIDIGPLSAEKPPLRPTAQSHGQSSNSKAQSGHSLIRPEDELSPWYTTPHLRNGAESRKTADQRLEDAYKDSSTKSSNDPLKAMQSYLAQRKAAKDLPRPTSLSSLPSSSSTHTSEPLSDLYEPDAVRAALSLRRRHSHRQHSAAGPESDSHSHKRHRSARSSSKDEGRDRRRRRDQPRGPT